MSLAIHPQGSLRSAWATPRLLPAALLLLLAGCLPHSASKQDPAEDPIPLRGHVLEKNGMAVFRPCGKEKSFALEDATGRLHRLLDKFAPRGEGERQLFAAVEGRLKAGHSGAPARINIGSVLYAGLEGPGCNVDWESFRFRASGNEPFWMAEVTGEGIRLVQPGLPELHWRQVEVRPMETGLRFLGVGDDDRPSLELVLVEEACRDSMSGFLFGTSALLRLGGRELAGCALEGDGSKNGQVVPP